MVTYIDKILEEILVTLDVSNEKRISSEDLSTPFRNFIGEAIKKGSARRVYEDKIYRGSRQDDGMVPCHCCGTIETYYDTEVEMDLRVDKEDIEFKIIAKGKEREEYKD